MDRSWMDGYQEDIWIVWWVDSWVNKYWDGWTGDEWVNAWDSGGLAVDYCLKGCAWMWINGWLNCWVGMMDRIGSSGLAVRNTYQKLDLLKCVFIQNWTQLILFMCGAHMVAYDTPFVILSYLISMCIMFSTLIVFHFFSPSHRSID